MDQVLMLCVILKIFELDRKRKTYDIMTYTLYSPSVSPHSLQRMNNGLGSSLFVIINSVNVSLLYFNLAIARRSERGPL